MYMLTLHIINGHYQKLPMDITSIGLKTHPQSYFYPSDNNFTQSLHVMLVKNMISVWWINVHITQSSYN